MLSNRFSVEEEIARRPNCIICKGTDKELNTQVAVKFFLDRPRSEERWVRHFKEEVSFLRAVAHPSLVPVIGGDCEDDWLYLLMDFIPGVTLRDLLISKETPLSPEFALNIVSQLGEGLKELHKYALIHGHIDSGAVFFNNGQVRLAGYYPKVIASMQKARPNEGRMLNEPAYIAPEQISGTQVDSRADIFALSVLLFELLTASLPYQAENPIQMAMLRLTQEPLSPSKINPEVSLLLEAAILKGLAITPQQRFARVDDFLQAIHAKKKISGRGLLTAADVVGEKIMSQENAISSDSASLLPGGERSSLGTRSVNDAVDIGVELDEEELEAGASTTGDTGMTAAYIKMGVFFAAVTMVCCLVVFFAYKTTVRRKIAAAGVKQIKEIEQKKEAIARLKREGEELLKAGQLVEPGAANAKKFFQQVLRLDKDDAEAKQRLAEIEEQLKPVVAPKENKNTEPASEPDFMAEAERLFAARAYISPAGANAREIYKQVLAQQPQNEKARARIAEIDKLVADMSAAISGLLAQARQYQAQGQFVLPRGENAYDVLMKILAIDPANAEANDVLYSMAAQSVLRGDEAKQAADLAQMRRGYLTAQALGVDPEFLKLRMKGVDIIQKSRADVIFVDRQTEEGKSQTKPSTDKRYLNTEELQKKMSQFDRTQPSVPAKKGRRFMDVSSDH